MQIRENVPIASLTTMRLGGNARYVIEITEIDDIAKAYDFAREHNLPTWIMGGGANTIGHDGGFNGVIILNRLKGIFADIDGEMLPINSISTDREVLSLTGMGGETWDDFVGVACELGYSGIEAMSKIPGTLGAAPVQNIGAYGQDISQVIKSVKAYDTKTGEIVVIPKSEMQMSYRHTRFNFGPDAGRYFIIAVTVELQKTFLQPPFYNSLQRYLNENKITDYSPMSIRNAVSKIRAAKLPDPEKIASAGSFFKNVYLDKSGADSAEMLQIPLWRDEQGGGKINAGWLIEQCGLKGKIMRGIRVSDKAALVLINESAKSYEDLVAVRQEIINAVLEKYGYVLEQEPVELS